MDKVAIGRVVLTSREHIIGLEPLERGLMGTLLRYPYEVRDEKEYFDEIQDVKVTKDMLDLAKHIVSQKAADFEPERFEDHYEEALTELINAKRQGKTISGKPRPRGENVVDLMDALKKSLANEAASPKNKKPRKVSAGQKEMLLPIEGKKTPSEKICQAGAGNQAQSRIDMLGSRGKHIGWGVEEELNSLWYAAALDEHHG
jgi:DNA end-binding protein Ku